MLKADPGRLVFSADGDDGFGAYHDLYDSGTTVSRTEGPFRASVAAFHFPRMLFFNRQVAGAVHHRSADRIRRDGFDHVNLQVLRSGRMAAGTPGDERAMLPGDIVVFDTSRPQRTFVAEADYLSVAITRDAITTSLPDVGSLHGVVLSGGAASLLGDFLISLGRHIGSITPGLASESAGMAGTLLGSIVGSELPKVRRTVDASAAIEMYRWRAEAFIDAHLDDRALDADTIAAGIGVSRTTLYAAFKPVNGVARQILDRRIRRLSEALLRTDETRSIGALAFDLGFADESHCNRAFKAAFGCPPGQFRAESRRVRISPRPARKAGDWAAWWSDIS